jgi:hypothetical protein
MGMPPLTACPDRVKAILAALRSRLSQSQHESLVFHPEAANLVVAETGDNGKEPYAPDDRANRGPKLPETVKSATVGCWPLRNLNSRVIRVG